MIAMLQLFIAPLLAAGFTLWAAWLALAAESDADLPRALAGEAAGATLSRQLHVAHLALLVLAGTAAGGAGCVVGLVARDRRPQARVRRRSGVGRR